MNIDNIISEVINRFANNKLLEVRYIDTHSGDMTYDKRYKKDSNQVFFQDPIKNDERIRVFHGCDLETAVMACTVGLSGREKPKNGRSYSYEAGMNPLGLFVTTNFYKAKEFGSSNQGMCVLEFSAKASDLESPVWNGSGSYFGQGTDPRPFKNAEERNAQKMKYRNDALNIQDDHTYDYYRDKDGRLQSKRVDIPMDFIRKSDKPEMAYNLFMNNENQALFMGDLDPNMIKRVWVNLAQEDGYVHTNVSYVPMSRKDFARKFKDTEFNVRGYYDKKEKIRNNKLFYPNEDVKTIDDVVKRYVDKHEKGEDYNEVRNNLIEYGFFDKNKVLNIIGKETLRDWFWPKQIKQIYGEDFFNDNFNWLGQ